MKKAIPGAKLVEVGPDFVGLSDVAEIVGVTRQNMRKLMLAHVTTFPMPLHEGSAAVWHLAPVLEWLKSAAPTNLNRPCSRLRALRCRSTSPKRLTRSFLDSGRELRRLVA